MARKVRTPQVTAQYVAHQIGQRIQDDFKGIISLRVYWNEPSAPFLGRVSIDLVMTPAPLRELFTTVYDTRCDVGGKQFSVEVNIGNATPTGFTLHSEPEG